MKTKSPALALFFGVAAIATSDGALILAYDSLLPSSGGSATDLSRINSQTDAALVSASGVTSTIGARGTLASINTQTVVQGPWGDQGDMQFRFGNGSTPGNGTLGGTLNAGHVGLGPYLAFNYTAGTAQTLDQFSFHLFVNSNNASSYAARDVGLFVSVDGSGYSQFGALSLRSGRGNQGTVTFSDSLEVAAGEVVDIRLGFTDRTRTNNDNQAATRIGDVQIFATAIPEPSSALLCGFAGLSFLLRRRR